MSSSRDSLMNALSMNGGEGEHSYASNSHGQRNNVFKMQPVVEESVKEMLMKLKFPGCIKVADLGCSSGQNTFMVMSTIVNTILESYKGRNPPEIDYCLNDLPGNDFNSTFKLVPCFKKEVNGNCFVRGVPGSFYSRLFPSKSLHFLYSSFSVHWLSKVPQGLEDNTKSVYITGSTPLSVRKSYMEQFQSDFSMFLRMRSQEMLPNGRMILMFKGRNDLDIEGDFLWSLLSAALLDLVSEGVVKESEADSFNLPFYGPSEGQIREIVRSEGSFEIIMIETHEVQLYKANDHDQSYPLEVGKATANVARSITEPLLLAHFGDINVINCFFDKFAHHATQHFISYPYHSTFNIILSLTRV